MSRRLMNAVCVCGLLALNTSPLFAIDIVTQKSTNKQILGDITAVTKTDVSIKPKTGEAVKVPANDIAKIKWDGEPAKLAIAVGDEDRGNFEKALETYEEVLKSSSGNLKTYLEFLIARTAARQALEDSAKADDAVKKLEAFNKAHDNHFGFYDVLIFLGQVQAAKGDYAKAQAAYEALGKAPWNDYKMLAKIAGAKMQLKQNDVDGAGKSFDDIIAGAAQTDAEKARRAEAQAGKAACLVKQQKHDDALKMIDEVIKATSIDESRTMAETYNLQGDCYQAQNKLKEAALAYLHVPILFPREKAAHAEALYHLSKISGTLGQPDRAAEARDDLLANFPNSEWAKKLQAGN